MNTRKVKPFNGQFGKFLNSLRGRTLDGVELTDKLLAMLLGVCPNTIRNVAEGFTEPPAGMVFAAATTLGRDASQLLIDTLEQCRQQTTPTDDTLSEIAQAQSDTASVLSVYADGMKDGRLDASEKAMLAFKAGQAADEWQDVRLAALA
jgi:transcriptional regulator with XRE-family HTH domain